MKLVRFQPLFLITTAVFLALVIDQITLLKLSNVCNPAQVGTPGIRQPIDAIWSFVLVRSLSSISRAAHASPAQLASYGFHPRRHANRTSRDSAHLIDLFTIHNQWLAKGVPVIRFSTKQVGCANIAPPVITWILAICVLRMNHAQRIRAFAQSALPASLMT